MRFHLLAALFVATAQGRFLSDDYNQLLQTAKGSEYLDTGKPIVMNGMYNKGGLGIPTGKTKRDNSNAGGLPSPPQGFETSQVTDKFKEFQKEFEKLTAGYLKKSKREEPSAEAQNPFATGFEVGKITEKFDEFKKEFENLTGGKKTKREDSTKPSSGGFEFSQMTEKFEELKKEFEKLTAGYGGSGGSSGNSEKAKREGGGSNPMNGFEFSQMSEKLEEFKKEIEKLTAGYGGSGGSSGGESDKTKREDTPDYSTMITSAMDTDRVVEAFDELKNQFEKLTKGEKRQPEKRDEEGGEGIDKLMETFHKEVETFFKEMEQMMQGEESKAQVQE